MFDRVTEPTECTLSRRELSWSWSKLKGTRRRCGKEDIFWSFKFIPKKTIKYHRLTRFIKGDTLVNWVSSTTLRGRPPCPPGRTSKWHVGTHLLIKEINISRLFLSFGCISFWKIARALYGCSQKGYWELQRNACEGFRIKGKLNCCKIKKFLCSLKT